MYSDRQNVGSIRETSVSMKLSNYFNKEHPRQSPACCRKWLDLYCTTDVTLVGALISPEFSNELVIGDYIKYIQVSYPRLLEVYRELTNILNCSLTSGISQDSHICVNKTIIPKQAT